MRALLILSSLVACTGRADSAADGEAVADQDADGFTVEDGDCDDTDASILPGAGCPCPAGTFDCDNDPASGCEATVAELSEAELEAGCCHPTDDSGNSLTDCDGDGYCECYGSCGEDEPSTAAYDPECLGE